MSTRSLQGSLQVLANPYSRGAVVFNSTPYTQFYMQQQQKEQAKDEALDKYFMNWDKSINPAGMRHIETQDLLTLTNENKVFYFKNKKSIKNPSLDNGAAYNEWSSRSQSAMGLISQSKELADRGKIINAAIIQAKQKGLPLTDKVVEDLKAFDKSVKSKDWRDFNINNLDFQPKQFDPTRFTKDIFSDIKLSDKLESEVKKPETMQILQTWTSSIDKANLPLIKQRASAAYYSNKSVKFEVDMYLNDANKYQELNKVFKDKFKTDIKNGEDMATALALSLSPIGKPFEKVVDDWVARFNLSQGQINRRHNESLAASQNKADQNIEAAPKYIQNARLGVTFEGKEGETLEMLNFPPMVADEFKVMNKTPKFGINSKGEVYKVFTQLDGSGKPTNIPDWTKTEVIPSYQINSVITNKALSSAFKVNSVTGNAKTPQATSGNTVEKKSNKKSINGF